MADTADLLRDILARLDTLERDNASLQQDNTILKQQNTALLTEVARLGVPTSPTASASVADSVQSAPALERISRRWVLNRGMQAAVATAVAGIALQQETQDAAAAVESFDQIVVGHPTGTDAPAMFARAPGPNQRTIISENFGGNTAIYGTTTGDYHTAIFGENFGHGPGVKGASSGNGPAVEGVAFAGNSIGVKGIGRYGVWGESSVGGAPGVIGKNAAGAGVKGEGGYGVWGVGANGVVGESTHNGYGAVYGKHVSNSFGPGVVGDGAGTSEPGVLGRNAIGAGVKGEGGFGVWGVGNNGVVGDSTATDYGAVWGNHKGTSGYGVVGDGKGTGRSGVLGRNAAGEGVRGEGATGVRGTTTSGVGVAGEGGSGYGGVFRGIRAQVRLTPTGRIGKPTTGAHQVGELYLDRAGTLFICTVAGTPGTWRKVSTTAS